MFTNTGSGSFIDLDSIVFETEIGSAECVFTFLVCVINQTLTLASSVVMTQTTMDDTSPEIIYLPQEDWIFDNAQGWFNDTLQYVLHHGPSVPCVDVFIYHSFTQTAGAQAQFAFNGDAVAIYGTVSPFLADYAVTTDGVTQRFHGSSQDLASSVHMDVSTPGCPCTVR